MTKSNILYYISSHGFGHAARAGQVIRLLKKDFNVFVKTNVPEWLVLQVAGSNITIIKESFDIGCLQSNNFDVDIEKTLNEYKKCSLKNRADFDHEISFLKKEKIDLIISDIASFPFIISKKLGIPSVFIGNFTWRGIYNFYIKDAKNDVISELDYQYGLCDYALITPFDMEMPELKVKRKINLIARRGENIRAKLNKKFSIPADNRLVFLYAGNQGTEDIDPDTIMNIKGYTFISFYPLSKDIDNYICIKLNTFRHQDITASSDVLIIKPGYGMISEAFVNQVPIVYAPREDFAEYFSFLDEFKKSGATFRINREDFNTGNFEASLNSVKDEKYKKYYPDTGAFECVSFVKEILSIYRHVT